MFSRISLVSLVAVATLVASSPVVVRDSPIHLPLARWINETGIANVVESDLARIASFKKGSHSSQDSEDIVGSVSAQNTAVGYTVNVGVGTPPTYYKLIVDTGSSNTWVGANSSHPYVITNSSVYTLNTVDVTYGSGSFFGLEYDDTVTLSTSLVATGQGVGAAILSSGFTGYDGILGLGPVDLTFGTLFPDILSTIPTITDTLYDEGVISAHEIGISFEPITSAPPESNGELTFGGTDSTKYTGTITYTPVTTTSPSSDYWGINQSIAYGTTTILSSTAGIVDTGTTLIYIASNAFSQYQTLTGAVYDSTTELYTITSAQYASLDSLFFSIGGTTFELTANAQIWPRSLNYLLNPSAPAGTIYLIVNDIGTASGSGMDFIDGFTFLERFYSVFDSGSARVGFADTAYTHATTN